MSKLNNPSEESPAWDIKAIIIGLTAAAAGLLLILIDDFIPRYQQGVPIFSEVSEVLEFLVLCPGIGILGLLSAQFIIQRERDYNRKIEQEEARRFVALGRIAGSIAHEVRNPMQNIKLVLEELRSMSGSEQQELIGHIDDNLERINMVVKLAYELARPDYHVDADSEGPIALSELVGRVVADAQANCQHGIEINVLTQGCQVTGSTTGIQVALENVLRNAVQTCDAAGTPDKIFLRIYADKKWCYLEVINKGELPKELLSGDAETFTSKRSGLGLGLFIARHLLERMQGELLIAQRDTDVVVTFKMSKSDNG